MARKNDPKYKRHTKPNYTSLNPIQKSAARLTVLYGKNLLEIEQIINVSFQELLHWKSNHLFQAEVEKLQIQKRPLSKGELEYYHSIGKFPDRFPEQFTDVRAKPSRKKKK